MVFDLQCSHGHVFEAWFASSADYDRQAKRGLLECPICADQTISKALMAPAVGRKSNQQPAAPSTRSSAPVPVAAAPEPAEVKAMLAAMAQMQAQIEAVSEDVGDAFSEEARKIHYGESDERPIIGTATMRDARDLVEEGIEVMPLPFKTRRRRPVQ